MGLLGFGIGGLGLAAILRYEALPLETFALALLICYCSLVPLLIWFRKGGSTVPLFPLISISYGLYTAVGAISQPNTILILSKKYELQWEYINKALGLSLIGILTMIGMFMVVRRRMANAPYNMNLVIDPAKRYHVILLLVSSALVANFAYGMGWIPWGGHLQIIQGFLMIACVLTASFYYRGKIRGANIKVLLAVLLGYLCATGLATGMLETVFAPIFAVFVVRTAWLRRFPVMATLCGALLLGIVNSAKLDYRQRAWTNAEVSSFSQSMNVWADVLRNFSVKTFFLGDPGIELTPWRQSLARTSVIDRVAWVCVNTPSRIPFLVGESYYPFIYTPVPRLLWPNKPILSEALTQIDSIYDLATTNSQGNLTAAVGVSYIGEGYANFGVLGVIAVMAAQGLILAIVDALYNQPNSEGGVAIFVGVAVYMMNGVGSAAINIYGILLQMIICSTLVLLPFSEQAGNGRFTAQERMT